MKYDGMVCVGSVWLRYGTSGGLLCTYNEPLVNGECFDMLRTLSCVVLHINFYYSYCLGLPVEFQWPFSISTVC